MKGEKNMRIIIDTKNEVIICPKAFWEDIAKTNDVLRSVGQPEINHKDRIKEYFDKAIVKDLARPSDVEPATKVVKKRVEEKK